MAVTPCNANSAPATCPAPGFPANYLGQLNMYTGHITPLKLHGAGPYQPQGLIFVASSTGGAAGPDRPGGSLTIVDLREFARHRLSG